ncbi:acyl-CoA dehydratase activase-related protein [Proteiniphilum sp.]|uniref:acyl-CoA dehydratase activase-related protein n=1 Tax=Proteiniphilum sp. TaxID=1926877 RepID=UPI002B1F4550|nr:acyl-CoA dehydratase activase-related protein [Proteiniphilum sp.]MEA4916909.1 acyl-CoA dehydratase activase-related protein [Proteiniphilum sp.]
MKANNICKVGIDIGSTTLKVIVLDCLNKIIYKIYRRHKADFNKILIEELNNIITRFPDRKFTIGITGSAGMGISERTGIPFVQEVVASIEVIKKEHPDTHTMIDLGGEDAKMVFFQDEKQPDIRMNGSCAGGTGAFIDQMADLMNISVEELGKQALSYEKIYPVASRCGVFAKTDVQNLISRNIPVPDISMSILQAVAVQSMTTLAKGHEIQPKILCIGGPLTFTPALRNAFIELMKIDESDLILPTNSEYFSAWGTALHNQQEQVAQDLSELILKLQAKGSVRKDVLPALFTGKEEYQLWKDNRKMKPLKRARLGDKKSIECFLGIDSGSTTTKILIINKEGDVLFSFYDTNQGNPLKKVKEGLQKFFEEAKEKEVVIRFLSSVATGYGEDLIRSALNLDYGIVETMAHLSGAQYADPEVSFVLDIGGQDMKSIFIRDGVISNVELNEACSAGCGSFLQNFASTMNMSLPQFTEAACLAEYPSDLGSRCTVFMNSKVKQSLRENAALGDIAGGLAYSVVKNCLFKVLKISNLNLLGEHIVVQGGTFRNDAVYRALELLFGKSVSSTDCPELMGALGAALYAKKMWMINGRQATFTGIASLPDIDHINTREMQCKGCNNTCSILRFKFDNGNICYAGNKCEKIFFNKATAPEKGYNAFDWKNKVLFERDVDRDVKWFVDSSIGIDIERIEGRNVDSGFAGSRDRNFKNVNKELKGRAENNTNGNVNMGINGAASDRTRIGIPRVLNMFENYPFWHTLLAECGFEVVLSPESTTKMYQKGVGSVMSDNICFPAKLVHGHIIALAEQKVDRIFYPTILKEEKEFQSSNNSFNCPVVSGYPDVIRSAMKPEERFGIHFDKPVITFSNDEALEKACYGYVSSLGVSKAVFNSAFKNALQERENMKKILRDNQRVLFDKAVGENKLVFVVAGRPYHADPLVHQKVGQILSDMGVEVFTDDIFRHPKSKGFGKLNIVSQWSYPNRVIQAAMEVAKLPANVQLVQLNSFGCGPDSFFMDETREILKQSGKNHTVLRIDEIASPGSIRLRMRSLIESLKVIVPQAEKEIKPFEGYKTTYKKEDRKKTILAPWFADFVSPFIPTIGELAGYKIVNLPKTNKISAEAGLVYGHSEVCYPSTLVLGDIITALQSGNYDLDDVVVAITQTGGQCRATNYLAQIKMGMETAGFSHIPVVVVATGGVFQNEQKAFKAPVLKIINILIYTLLYADALQQMYSSTIIREKRKGETQNVFDFYVEMGIEAIRMNNHKDLLSLLGQAVADFNQIAIHQHEFTKVGLIGEIYVKYNNYGQAHITEWLRSKNMEVVTPPLIDFAMQYFVNSEVNLQNGVKRGSMLKHYVKPILWKYMNDRITKVEKIMEKYRFYAPSESVYTKAEYASQILDLSNQFGEGWSVAAEVACYAHNGINRVVCVQPFGCIANHIVAKGIENRLKKFYPDMNLLYLDVDGGMAEVNLQNRLHFLIN